MENLTEVIFTVGTITIKYDRNHGRIIFDDYMLSLDSEEELDKVIDVLTDIKNIRDKK